MTDRITVAGAEPYDVVVGTGALADLDALIPAEAERVAIVYQAAVVDVVAQIEKLVSGRCEIVRIEVPPAEHAKVAGVAVSAWDLLGSRGFTRSDLVIGVGGGAVTDVAGFIAATWLRGVQFIAVPTTLLGMVDAAIGGKTGINIDAGKNLVGAFHPPTGVICDLDTLESLPRADFAAGLAEVVKAGFIADPVILELIESDPAAATSAAGPHTAELIIRAVSVKAAVVSADLRENAPVGPGGLGREILNYGHTLAHAIEKRENFGWRHGDAVSVGLVFAAALAHAAGLLDKETADRHRAVLDSIGLPTSYPAAAWPELRAAMNLDKKTRGRILRFVVLEGLAHARILVDPDAAVLETAYAEVAR
ncbi:MAG: 3-dehydroquinate synthase [Actinomycetota bacterium]|nr:3-dehydroquinate synthase [Actinomycetota bacterium]